MNVDTDEVLKAAGTKWNFLKFEPGLVGGHCIGVDPYYLAYKSLAMDYNPEIILSGRKINDSMANYISTKLIKKLESKNEKNEKIKIAILGLTFKEDCPDLRNSKVKDIFDIVNKKYTNVCISDPHADQELVKDIYGQDMLNINSLSKLDALIIAVPHKEYQKIDTKFLKNILKEGAVIFDIKSLLSKDDLVNQNFYYWCL